MTPEPLEPVDWAAVKAVASGPRHYEGSEAKARPIWKCPACGEDNQGLLEEGCSSCHSGGGAQHVGVPPTAPPLKLKTSAEYDVAGPSRPHDPAPDSDAAFLQWAFALGRPIAPAETVMLAKAFKAGWYARGESPVQIVARPAEVSVVTIADSSDVLEGTIQSRTLVAALTFFADQVLKQQPEETVNGEWLKADQISSLIEDVKNRYV